MHSPWPTCHAHMQTLTSPMSAQRCTSHALGMMTATTTVQSMQVMTSSSRALECGTQWSHVISHRRTEGVLAGVLRAHVTAILQEGLP